MGKVVFLGWTEVEVEQKGRSGKVEGAGVSHWGQRQLRLILTPEISWGLNPVGCT